MYNIENITKGFYNLLKSKLNLLDKEVEQLSKYRLHICKSCENFNSIEKRCNICGCFLEAKTRVLNAVCGDKENPKW